MVHLYEKLTQAVEDGIHFVEDSAGPGARVIEKTDVSFALADDRPRVLWSASCPNLGVNVPVAPVLAWSQRGVLLAGLKMSS
jgi:hypothetical protein